MRQGSFRIVVRASTNVADVRPVAPAALPPAGWTGPELARRLEVSTRTVRNDVERLRKLGYPVDATPGPAGGYRLGVGATLPPLLLDDEEAVAVAVGLRSAAGGTVGGIEETSVRALAKLDDWGPPPWAWPPGASRQRGHLDELRIEFTYLLDRAAGRFLRGHVG
jgi:predicted DNA-binding transcriptional regulator YafY